MLKSFHEGCICKSKMVAFVLKPRSVDDIGLQKILFLEYVLFSICRSPQDCNRTQRMVYTSCKESVKRKFPAIALDVQACDDDDLSYESILEKAQRHVK